MSGNPPKNAVLLTRISDARSGDTKGVTDQEADERQLAARLGWGVGRVIVENDTSAFKRRKIRLPNGRHELRTVRPGFRQALDLLASGHADGMIAYDLDRACRDPRDLEDLIDVVESAHPRIPVESVTGSLKLANDGDVTMARVLVAVANKSSRDTGRRVARARLRQASEGRYGGGRRPFGFDADGTTVRALEAAEIALAADALLAGLSLAGVVADLNARGVASSTGRQWTAPAVRDMLLRPRNAGLIVYQGDIVDGVSAPWEPILPRERWEAVRALLTDPARRTTTGNTPRWLGSGLYRCGHPDCADLDPNPCMRVNSAPGHRRHYRCRRLSHLARVAEPLDAWVEQVIVARLSRPDAASLITVRADVDVAGLASEANELRARITTAGDLWESGVITDAELKVRRGRLNDRLSKLDAQMNAAAGSEPLAGLAGNPDAAQVWAGLDLARRRAVLDTIAVVTVKPAPRGRQPDGSYFDPATVRVEPK